MPPNYGAKQGRWGSRLFQSINETHVGRLVMPESLIVLIHGDSDDVHDEERMLRELGLDP
nr:hypothetical protein [Candidatus Njordarchaeota archaeon]